MSTSAVALAALDRHIKSLQQELSALQQARHLLAGGPASSEVTAAAPGSTAPVSKAPASKAPASKAMPPKAMPPKASAPKAAAAKAPVTKAATPPKTEAPAVSKEAAAPAVKATTKAKNGVSKGASAAAAVPALGMSSEEVLAAIPKNAKGIRIGELVEKLLAAKGLASAQPVVRKSAYNRTMQHLINLRSKAMATNEEGIWRRAA